MKFLLLCTLLLSVAVFMASAQADNKPPQKGDDVPPTPHHHHVVRSVRYADDVPVPPKGEAGCCG